MNRQEILTKAIEKAIAGGWHHFGGKNPDIIVETATYPVTLPVEYRVLIGPRPYSYANHSMVIFNHDFALALWPWDDSIKCPYCGICLTGSLMHPRPCPFGVAEVFAQPMWQYHLQQMVIADDPIAYLGENI